jgi:predicted transcriptional regulator
MNDILSRRHALQAEVERLVKKAIALVGSKHELSRRMSVRYETVLSWSRGATPSERRIGQLQEICEMHSQVEVEPDSD